MILSAGVSPPLWLHSVMPHDTPVITSTMSMTSRLSRRVLALIVASSGAPLLLAACGSEPTAADPSRAAGNLGTRVCLVNDTGQPNQGDGWLTLTGSVAFTRKDTAEEGAFPPGTRLCGEGTFGTGDDVVADLTWTVTYAEDVGGYYTWKSSVSATNKWIGPPKAELKSPRSDEYPEAYFSCLSQGFNVNESMTGDDGMLQMKVTRLADDQWKEFEVVFTVSPEDPFFGHRRMKSSEDCP